jgi:hypothetical protein
MIAKAYQLPRCGFPYQINDASQFRMVILFVPDLGKLNPSAKVIDYFLIILNWPLLQRVVPLSPSAYHPKPGVSVREVLLNLVHPGLFFIG